MNGPLVNNIIQAIGDAKSPGSQTLSSFGDHLEDVHLDLHAIEGLLGNSIDNDTLNGLFPASPNFQDMLSSPV